MRKPVTIALLAATTAAMAAMVYVLSGHAYAADVHPFSELIARFLGWRRTPLSRGALIAYLMPVIGNVLLFIPWGFLAFVSVDSPKRSRAQAYVITTVAALVVASAIFVWQEFLPTRVTSAADIAANAVGAMAGAALGHARKTVRVRFDF